MMLLRARTAMQREDLICRKNTNLSLAPVALKDGTVEVMRMRRISLLVEI
jgi:hypothetical protein